jgi:hypothetical protein
LQFTKNFFHHKDTYSALGLESYMAGMPESKYSGKSIRSRVISFQAFKLPGFQAYLKEPVISNLKKKYNMIVSYETATARSVALAVIRPKPFSVWEVLIPIIFIFGFMKSKETREVFAQNVLFTKKLAMQAAFDMLKKGQTRESVMEGVRSKTQEMIAAVPGGIYSAEIRQEQLKEIDLLVDHYCRLLNSEGEDYDSLVFNAYQTPKRLADFFEQLQKAEENVGRAAHNTLGGNADTATLDKMNAALRNIRHKFTEKIFHTRLQSQNAQ